MPDFRGGSSANQADLSLKKCVATMNQAQHCAVLWFGEIKSRRLYRELGYSSMRAYAMEELGFSSTRTGDFMRLCEKLEKLPVVKGKVESGELGYTHAREIIKVADHTNENEWVEVAENSTRQELVAVVKHSQKVASAECGANPAQGELVPRPSKVAPISVKPLRVGFDLTPTQFARYEAMLKKVRHRGSQADLLLEMMESLLASENIAPRGATQALHYQVNVLRCPDCESHSVVTSQGEKDLLASEAETIACDALVSKPGQRNTSIIPPLLRGKVLARDRYQCRRKGCQHTRYLDIHHLVPRAKGGGNAPENLVTLCTGCHQLWHEKEGDLRPLLRPVKPSSKRQI